MGSVKSWPIEYDALALRGRSRTADAADAATSATASAAAAQSGENETSFANATRVRKSTGLFQVTASDGNPIDVALLVSSFASERHSVVVTVARHDRGERETVLFRAVDVPAGGAAKLELEGLAGDEIEVIVSLPSEELLPSVAVTKTFIADGAVVLQQLRSPADFVRI